MKTILFIALILVGVVLQAQQSTIQTFSQTVEPYSDGYTVEATYKAAFRWCGLGLGHTIILREVSVKPLYYSYQGKRYYKSDFPDVFVDDLQEVRPFVEDIWLTIEFTDGGYAATAKEHNVLRNSLGCVDDTYFDKNGKYKNPESVGKFVISELTVYYDGSLDHFGLESAIKKQMEEEARQEILSKADEAYEKGEYENAIALYKEGRDYNTAREVEEEWDQIQREKAQAEAEQRRQDIDSDIAKKQAEQSNTTSNINDSDAVAKYKAEQYQRQLEAERQRQFEESMQATGEALGEFMEYRSSANSKKRWRYRDRGINFSAAMLFTYNTNNFIGIQFIGLRGNGVKTYITFKASTRTLFNKAELIYKEGEGLHRHNGYGSYSPLEEKPIIANGEEYHYKQTMNKLTGYSASFGLSIAIKDPVYLTVGAGVMNTVVLSEMEVVYGSESQTEYSISESSSYWSWFPEMGVTIRAGKVLVFNYSVSYEKQSQYAKFGEKGYQGTYSYRGYNFLHSFGIGFQWHKR